jgi:hypothetical protein
VEQMTAAICVHLRPFSDILLRPDLLPLGWNIMFLMLAWAMDVEDALISCHHSSSTCIGWLYNLILLGTLCDSPESRLLVCVNVRGWVGYHGQLFTVVHMFHS